MQKLGIGADGVKTTPLSGQPDFFKGPSPEAGQLLQMGVNSMYGRFLGIVAEARHKTPQQVDQIAQGFGRGRTRRWLGQQPAAGEVDQLLAVDRHGQRATHSGVAVRARLGGVDQQVVGLAELGLLGDLEAAVVDEVRDDGTVGVGEDIDVAALAQRRSAVVESSMTLNVILSRYGNCTPSASFCQ